MRYFFKQYWRYIAMALAFATFNFLINACEVKAETNYNQSIDVNFSETTNGVDVVIWNDPNHTSKAFANAGRGYLVGIFMTYKYSTNTSFEMPTVRSINARTDSGYSTCEVSSLSNDMNDSTQMKAAMYGFKCDLTMSTNGLISLSINMHPNVNNSFTKELFRLTFNNNLQAQEVQYEQYVYDYMQNFIYPKLNEIDSNTTTSANQLQYIYSYLQNFIYTALQNQASQAHQDAQAQKEATEDINDSINSDDTTGGSTEANNFFNNFDEGDTGTLMDIVSLPLDFLDSLNNTCQPISITIPYFDETYNLPCLRTYLNGKFPTIVTLITLLINGILCYRVLKAFVDLINKLKDPNNDDIEVMDL